VEAEFVMYPSTTHPNGQDKIGIIAMAATLTHVDDSGFDREEEIRRARQGYQYLLAKRNLQIPPAKQAELMKLFSDVPIWRHTFFQNVQILKNPLDLWMMQQIIFEIQPDFIVETGTFRGGSALYWAHTLNGMGLENSRVITVDIQDLA